MLNPELKVGDRIVLLQMDDAFSPSTLERGKVISVTKDPFEDGIIYGVKWDDGSSLSLVSTQDMWVKEEYYDKKNKITEAMSDDEVYNFLLDNYDLLGSFDWMWFKNQYLKKLQKSGIVNMFGASPFLYSGKEWILRFYDPIEGLEDEFYEVVDMADEARQKFTEGIIKYSMKSNVNLDNLDSIARDIAKKLLATYMKFY